MPPKKSTGPTLTQRERKRLAVEAKQKELEELEAEKAEENKPKPPTIPQEDFLRWIGGIANEHGSSDKFIQLSTLAFVINLAYVRYKDLYMESEKDSNLLISAACGIIALVSAVIIAFRVQTNNAKKEGSTEPIPLPPWNIIYLIFLPSFLALTLNKDLLLYNVALTSTLLNLPFFAKILVQMSILGSNSDHTDYIVNFKVTAGHLAINYVLGQISEYKSLDKVEVNLFSILLTDLYLIDSDSLYVLILQKLFISFGAGIVLIYFITKTYNENNWLRTILLMCSWTGTFVGLTMYQLDPKLGKNSIVWIYEYAAATPTRIQILSIWLVSLILLIPTIFNYKIQLSPNFRRKIWHFLVLGLIVYPLHLDAEFVKVSLAGSLILFLVVEQIRYLKLYPFGVTLDKNLRLFADFRDDKGPIIISYIYLFIGISLPILFNNSVVGLVVLGVGDSLASIIGSNYGTINWGRSQKTVEGTMTFVTASFAVCAALKQIGWFFQNKTFHSLLLTCTLSGILEGNSNLNDNILIPGFMSIVLEILD